MKSLLALCTALCAVFCTTPLRSETLELSLSPETPVNGSPVLFRVETDTEFKSMEGSWLGHRIAFDFDPTTKAWYALAGVHLSTNAGEYPLAISALTPANQAREFTRTVSTTVFQYPKRRLPVADKFTNPDAEAKKRINRDRARKKEVFRLVSDDRCWSGEFVPPVDRPISSPFGTQRVFNGTLQSVHEGLDFDAENGTPVRAMNSGSVILAEDFFFDGGMVVIDHGQGLLSLYMHLSKFEVREGDSVNTGQVIAESGATGRVTGPCLDVRIRWQGVYLNPETLLGLSLPALP